MSVTNEKMDESFTIHLPKRSLRFTRNLIYSSPAHCTSSRIWMKGNFCFDSLCNCDYPFYSTKVLDSLVDSDSEKWIELVNSLQELGYKVSIINGPKPFKTNPVLKEDVNRAHILFIDSVYERRVKEKLTNDIMNLRNSFRGGIYLSALNPKKIMTTFM